MTYQKRKNPSSDTFIKVRFIFKSHPKNRNNEEKTSKKKLPLQDFSISKATAPSYYNSKKIIGTLLADTDIC